MLTNIKLLVAAFTTAMAIGMPASVQAQYVGPSTQKTPLSVAEVLKNPVDDQNVVLRGYLLKKVGKENYLFSDGTAEIRVEIDARDFPAQKIDDKTRVEIRGEVETEFFETPQIDVKVISILP